MDSGTFLCVAGVTTGPRENPSIGLKARLGERQPRVWGSFTGSVPQKHSTRLRLFCGKQKEGKVGGPL